jgi:hypothetical protein
MDRVELEQLLGTKVLLPRSDSRSITGWVDLLTLLTVLSGATLWGLVALGVINADPSRQMRAIYGLIGLAAIWQWARQRRR